MTDIASLHHRWFATRVQPRHSTRAGMDEAGRYGRSRMAIAGFGRPSAYDGWVARTDSSYTARHLSVLEGLEAVRKRPGMYIGTTDSRGLMQCLWEILDNAVDESLEGYGDTIEVVLHPDQSVEVRDNGRGIPVDTVDGLGLSGDRKSTRLNSSHVAISYAVFCLKKKK